MVFFVLKRAGMWKEIPSVSPFAKRSTLRSDPLFAGGFLALGQQA